MTRIKDRLVSTRKNDTVEYCDARELSSIAGVDESTLRHYDRIGLLQRSRSGFSHEDLIRIERITMMTLLGFTPSEIRDGLDISRKIGEELEIQRRIWVDKKRRLSHLLYFIEQAQQVNSNSDSRDWYFVGRVVAAMRTLHDPEFFRLSYLQERRNDPDPAEQMNNGRVDSPPHGHRDPRVVGDSPQALLSVRQGRDKC